MADANYPKINTILLLFVSLAVVFFNNMNWSGLLVFPIALATAVMLKFLLASGKSAVVLLMIFIAVLAVIFPRIGNGNFLSILLIGIISGTVYSFFIR